MLSALQIILRTSIHGLQRSVSGILLTVTEAVVNLHVTIQGIQTVATGKLKVLLADRFSWCEQSAEGVKC